MMYKRFRYMEYLSAPDLHTLQSEVDCVVDNWETDAEDACTNRYCAEPVGAPSYIDHIGFVQALALYYWDDIEEGNDAR